jgi:hypothetical protein
MQRMFDSSGRALRWLGLSVVLLVGRVSVGHAQQPGVEAAQAPAVTAPVPTAPTPADTAAPKVGDDPVQERVSGGDFLSGKTWMALDCPSGNVPYEDGRQAVRLKETCRLSIGWYAKHVEATLTFLPRVFRIRAVGAADDVFAYALNDKYPKRTFSEDWYTNDRFKVGREYAADIVYDVYEAGNPTAVGEEVIRVYQFRPVKNRFAFQVTPKVFTAWEISDDGDRSYLVPAVAFGGAVRTSADYNNQDIFAVRLMVGAGPNLIATTELERDEAGAVTGVKSRQKIQVVAGFELVFWRYLSAGLAWVPMGRDKSSTPLVLLSYGELYPAVVNTP